MQASWNARLFLSAGYHDLNLKHIRIKSNGRDANNKHGRQIVNEYTIFIGQRRPLHSKYLPFELHLQIKAETWIQGLPHLHCASLSSFVLPFHVCVSSSSPVFRHRPDPSPPRHCLDLLQWNTQLMQLLPGRIVKPDHPCPHPAIVGGHPYTLVLTHLGS